MFHLLIISDDPNMSKTLEIMLDRDQYRCHLTQTSHQGISLIDRKLVQCCIVDKNLCDISAVRIIEDIRKVCVEIPILVTSQITKEEWEEEAILKGANFTFNKPIRGRLISEVLNRLCKRNDKADSCYQSDNAPLLLKKFDENKSDDIVKALPTLEIIRDFSRIFSFTYNFKSFAYEFALKLREILCVNKIAIFLEKNKPFTLLKTTLTSEQKNKLDCLCSVGIDPEIFNYITLTKDSGIGYEIFKKGKILYHATNPVSITSKHNIQIDREFSLIGGNIAIPITDREKIVGAAIIGERLTGSTFHSDEIQLLYHLLEELGLSIKNNLLHQQLVSNHNLISNVFSQMVSGCLVVDKELNILHVNPSFLKLLNLPSSLQFSHIPKKLAGLLYESAQLGRSHSSFLYITEFDTSKILRISIFSYQKKEVIAGAMIFVEDFTLIEKAKKAEVQNSNLRLLSNIAEKFAHEIRNALVPLKTCGQLIPERHDNPDFRSMLEDTIQQETRRIGRLTDQLLFLSKQDLSLNDRETPETLLKAAFEQVKALYPNGAEIECGRALSQCLIDCDSSSLRHAFFEILLNGIQSNPDYPKIIVSGSLVLTNDKNHLLKISFVDQGSGFTPDVCEQATEAFFTTRNVGVGLGLSVAKKIIDAHQGTLELNVHKTSAKHSVTVSLPVTVIDQTS